MGYGTVPEDMSHANHVDRRHTQTQERYAADDLETMQAARRYSAHLFNLFRAHLGKRVLEVGSGIGTMTRPLADAADLVVGLEPNTNCVGRLEDAMRGHPRFVLRACHLEECDPAELHAHRFDTVVCVNVLEHIERDRDAASAMADLLVPGGRLVILVPAIPFLYNSLDRTSDHYRRYSRTSLRAALAGPGRVEEAMFYMNLAGVLAWFINGHVLRKSNAEQVASVAASPASNRIFRLLELAERPVRLPLGLSLIAVYRKLPAPS